VSDRDPYAQPGFVFPFFPFQLNYPSDGLPHYTIEMEERAFYRESPTTKPVTLNCPFCRTSDSYDLRWMVRKKVEQLPRGADERDRARFTKFLSYMVLVDDKAVCKNIRCRKRFDVSGIKTMAFI
jgi:hypothetical protein